MKFDTEKITAISAAFLVFVYTFVVGSYFVGGDQIHYRSIYEVSSQNSIIDAYAYYRSRILSDEVGHFMITWLASQFLEKDLFNALANSILAFFSVRLFIKWKAHPLIAFVISLFGYYHIAMYLSAERLKFATIFFVIGLFYFSKKRLSVFLFLMCLVTHLQYALMVAVFFFRKFFYSLRLAISTLKIKYSDISLIFLFGLFVFILSHFFLNHLLHKLSAYYEGFLLSEFLKLSIFFLMSLFYSRKTKDVILSFSLLFLAVSFLGGQRINIFGYFLFLFYALPIRRGFNVGVILTIIYFGFGWAEYVFWVVTNGLNRPC